MTSDTEKAEGLTGKLFGIFEADFRYEWIVLRVEEEHRNVDLKPDQD